MNCHFYVILVLLMLGLCYSATPEVIRILQLHDVPYASPPIGHLRFQEPIKHEAWQGVRNATKLPDRCAQPDQYLLTLDVLGSEDCLYLEISEPLTSRNGSKELLPVLLWIHGGTFVFGAPHVSGPDYFVEKPVVYINVQYRLNIFGFLSTTDECATGNFGLKDQLLALHWIQRNVKNFGGDPNRVTISGASAGAASVILHCLSPKSQGLFHRAISLSGTPLNRWALQRNPLEKMRRLAKGLGIDSDNTSIIVEELRRVDYRVLVKTVYNKSIMGDFIPYDAHSFAPSVEAEGPTAFITERAFKLLDEGKFAKVPHIIGHTTEEGSFAYDYIHSGTTNLHLYETSPEILIPSSMNIPRDSACSKKTLDEVKTFYFHNKTVTDPFSWTKYMSQDLFTRGIAKTAQLLAKKADVYYYILSYNGSRPMSYHGGVGHYEDILYLFYVRNRWTNVRTPLDDLIRKRLVTIWTNFVTTGNPTPYSDPLLQNVTWPKFDEEESFLDINKDLTIGQAPERADRDFWKELFRKCGSEPYHTY
ncbi:venom carboxylesterase-6-like [Photinus pyralis]|nr:venom carboxylesterase-6-like [Photinus pyralis]